MRYGVVAAGVALGALLLGCQGKTITADTSGGSLSSTEWHLEPSLKYDSLCLINVLTGDQHWAT